MKRSEFHFDLPPELIAQHPAARREEARLLVADPAAGTLLHRRIPDSPGSCPRGRSACPTT
jgi:S-adenosylmethionine:tRNA ribosyltransferase-isomerase